MAKKKLNVRKDYSYEAKKRLPSYKPAAIQRKVLFLVLRGPGLDQDEVLETNEILKKFAVLNHKKIKFVQVKTEPDAIKTIKESNTWAGGVVFIPGDLSADSVELKKAIKSILIKTVVVKDQAASKAAFEKLIATQA
jgi:hypothetical protein